MPETTKPRVIADPGLVSGAVVSPERAASIRRVTVSSADLSPVVAWYPASERPVFYPGGYRLTPNRLARRCKRSSAICFRVTIYPLAEIRRQTASVPRTHAASAIAVAIGYFRPWGEECT